MTVSRKRIINVELLAERRLSEGVQHQQHILASDEHDDDAPPTSGVRLVRSQVGCATSATITLIDLIRIAVVLGLLLTPRFADANGKFPSADHLVVDPMDPSHMVVRTTFGVLTTTNAGADWDWICQSAAHYANVEPGIAIASDGSLLMGLFEGVSATGPAGCDWSMAMGGVTPDVSTSLHDPSVTLAITRDETTTYYWESTDNAVSFSRVGVDLPAGFMGVTVDVAPSDPTRIYVSGINLDAATDMGAMAVSKDGGATWLLHAIPTTADMFTPYIGAVDPLNADRVYVRLSDKLGALVVSDDAGDTWTSIDMPFSRSTLMGLAVSPDGATVVVGGDADGVWRASASDSVFEKISELAVRCLTWTDVGLYACVNELLYQDGGYLVGISHDNGDSFEPLVTLSCIRGPLDCAADTSVGALCPLEWEQMAENFDTASCGGEGSGSGPGSGSGDSSTGSGPTVSSGAGGGAAVSTQSGSCHLGGDDDAPLAVLFLGALAGIVRRRRSRLPDGPS